MDGSHSGSSGDKGLQPCYLAIRTTVGYVWFPALEKATMTKRRRRVLLLGLIAIEVIAAVFILRWVLEPGEQAGRLQPGEASSSNAIVETRPIEAQATTAPPESVPAQTETPTPMPTARPTGVWIEIGIPESVSTAIQDWLSGQSGQLVWADASTAELTVSWRRRAGATPLAEIVLVPVVPFFSLSEGIRFDDLRRTWLGRAHSGDTPSQLLVTAETSAALHTLFGPPGAEAPLTIVAASELADRLWTEPGAVAIVPFDQLEPRLQPLQVDGLSALERELELQRYPLRANIWISGPRAWQRSLVTEIEERGLSTNRHPDHLTMLVMTGVTALTRGVALRIEAEEDYGWPARRVADLLASADLTHVSNETSFVPGCQAQSETSAFCAKPEYLETLRLVGADLVELTGNHNLDFGPAYALLSLDLYAEAGIHTFGGGRDAADSHRPLLITHNGNHLAFLGYNQFGPDYAWATAERPGAARFSLEAVQADLAQVRPQADLVFVNVQHTETYESVPLPEQVSDFRAVVQAGANVVTGSQAHQPQAIEFHEGKPIFYGLGNLFFDQTWSVATRQSLIVRHVIYDGRLLSSQVIPTVMDRDCQPRLADAAEREIILQAVFAASEW